MKRKQGLPIVMRILKKYLYIIPGILFFFHLLNADFKPPEDSFFYTEIKRRYDRGFYVLYDFKYDISGEAVMRGMDFGFIMKKRARENKPAPVFFVSSSFVRKINNPYSVFYQVCPFDFGFQVYINTGKFTKGSGTIHPMFGIAAGTMITGSTFYGIILQNTGITGRALIGSEFLFLPPSFGLKVNADFYAYLLSPGKLFDFAWNFQDPGYGASLSIGLVVYVK